MHTPGVLGEIVAPFVPPAVQTAGVVVENTTTSPDDADAVTTSAASLSVRSANGPKVIVCGVEPTAEPADQLPNTGKIAPATSATAAIFPMRRRRGDSLLSTPVPPWISSEDGTRTSTRRRGNPSRGARYPRRRVSSGSSRAALIDG